MNDRVSAVVTRLEDGQGSYCFLRNNTRIMMGKGDKILGSAVMTNPGSFGFKDLYGWEGFLKGEGPDIFEGTGSKPDPTMRCITMVVREAYQRAGLDEPDGYINIYNISSVRCSNGKKALECHEKARKIMEENGLNIRLLNDPAANTEEGFKMMCSSSPFVIIGFLRGKFIKNVYDIKRWINDNSIKNIAYASDRNLWPSHPFTWSPKVDLRERAIESLYSIIK